MDTPLNELKHPLFKLFSTDYIIIIFVNRWMDGCFQDLDGESIEGKVDEFFREVYKMLKFFQQRQNKAGQGADKTAGSTKPKPGEDDPKKQEIPTILLCTTVMEQIKEFKVLYLALLLTLVLLINVVMGHIIWNALCDGFVSTEPYPRSFHLV